MLHFGNTYMKFLSPPLRDVTFTNAQCAATSVWDNVEVLLLVIIVWQGYLALIMKKKVSLSQNFYLGCVYIPSCEARKHCRAEIAQYRLEIIFKVVKYHAGTNNSLITLCELPLLNFQVSQLIVPLMALLHLHGAFQHSPLRCLRTSRPILKFLTLPILRYVIPCCDLMMFPPKCVLRADHKLK